ncbi:MAG TPA: DUF4173 domain-containing protein [Actinomycetota bacterium]|nr:DUF4173 domain-containing protein [Actinomycetota bacterium]
MSEGRSEERRDGRAWVGIAGAALVAALLIPSGPPGIGFFLTGTAIAVAVIAARARPLDLEAAGFAAAALLFLAMATFFDAEWVVAVDVLAAAGCSAVAATSARTWASILGAPFRVVRETVRVPSAVVASVPRFARRLDPGAAARALGLSALLLLTFGALFTSADAAFARLAGDVLLPDVAPELLPARILVGALVLAGAGGLVLAGRNRAEMLSPSFDDVWNRPPRRPIATVEWALPLALLDALFAAFVLVQVTVLFGGHEHVLETTGLTYAQYAREGFFQLTWIAVLVLGVIAISVRVLRETPRQRLLKALLGTLCALTLVVLVSALRRMDLYEAAYGLTRVRVSVHAALLWMGGVFVLVMVAGATRRAGWLPRSVLVFTVAALLAFNASNPDARIARAGVERWRSAGDLDGGYLATLSADAIPTLMELPPEERRCIVGLIGDRTRRASGAWSSFNLSRERALDLIGTEASGCTYVRTY